MALRQQSPTGELRQICQNALADRGCGGEVLEEILLEVDTLTAEDVAAGAGMEAAQLGGYRILTRYETGEPALSEWTLASGNDPSQFRGLCQGGHCQDGWDLVQAAKLLADVKEFDFDLRLLSIPDLQVRAFLLRCPSKTCADLVIPYVYVASGLKAKPVYPIQEFLEILKPLAQARLQFDDSNFL